jgi:Polysaccharide lyase
MRAPIKVAVALALCVALITSLGASGTAGAATDSTCSRSKSARCASRHERAISLFFAERFDGMFTTGFFQNEPTSALSFVPGFARLAARLSGCAAVRPGTCTDGTVVAPPSAYAQLVAVDAPSSPANDLPHAGRAPGSGTDCCDGNGQHGNAWYRVRLRFPPGYQATPLRQNTIFQLHVDAKTEQDAAAHGQSAYSTALLVESSVPPRYTLSTACPGSPMFCVVPGVHPHLSLQVAGGSTADSYATAVKHFANGRQPLRMNHWYDVVLHVVWDPSPRVGRVQWWVDGRRLVDTHLSTQYTRGDGTTSYAENIEALNYRLWASWPSSIDFDNLLVGPTAATVGFKPHR